MSESNPLRRMLYTRLVLREQSKFISFTPRFGIFHPCRHSPVLQVGSRPHDCSRSQPLLTSYSCIDKHCWSTNWMNISSFFFIHLKCTALLSTAELFSFFLFGPCFPVDWTRQTDRAAIKIGKITRVLIASEHPKRIYLSLKEPMCWERILFDLVWLIDLWLCLKDRLRKRKKRVSEFD